MTKERMRIVGPRWMIIGAFEFIYYAAVPHASIWLGIMGGLLGVSGFAMWLFGEEVKGE